MSVLLMMSSVALLRCIFCRVSAAAASDTATPSRRPYCAACLRGFAPIRASSPKFRSAPYQLSLP
jgi:hypothetical protein